jgi:hypothetical protein
MRVLLKRLLHDEEKQYIGVNFNEFLEEGIREEVEKNPVKKVLLFRLKMRSVYSDS